MCHPSLHLFALKRSTVAALSRGFDEASVARVLLHSCSFGMHVVKTVDWDKEQDYSDHQPNTSTCSPAQITDLCWILTF